MVKVRRATAADLEDMIAMGRALHAESPRYRDMAFDDSKLRELGRQLLGTLIAPVDTAVMLVAEADGVLTGCVVGMVAERWFSRERFATDLTVYVKPQFRGGRSWLLLMRAFESWARSQGVLDLAVGVSTEIHPEQTVSAYERTGWSVTGYTLTKRLIHGD